MPNYVKVVPSIAIAFVSYEQVNDLPLGLHCKHNAASASEGMSCECDVDQHKCPCTTSQVQACSNQCRGKTMHMSD